MKLGLKKKIDNVIKLYQENCKDQANAIMNALEPYKNPSYVNRFTHEGLKEEIKEAMSDILSYWKNYDKLLNDKVNSEVESAKKDVMDVLHIKNEKKSNDYAIRIANAREFTKIQIDEFYDNIGKEKEFVAIKKLDEALFPILKDFIDDYDTMKLFSKMIEIKTRIPAVSASGEPSLPITFGKMMKVDSIMNAFNEVEESASMLFIHARTNIDEVIRIHGEVYGVPADGYSEQADEENIITNATILDALTDMIDCEGQESTVGEGQNIDLDDNKEV